MTTTPVGMRCPECTRERTRVTNPVGAAGGRDAPAAYALIAICVAAFLAQLGTGGSIARGGGELVADGGFATPLIDHGEIYRVLTYGFLHSGIFHLGLNMLALYFLGTLLEPAIGTGRFLGIYVLSILGGALGVALIEPEAGAVGASGGVFGLMAAAFLIARQRGLDALAAQIGFFVLINLVFTFSYPNISIGGHLGGLVAGGAAAMLLALIERRRPSGRGALEAGAFAVAAVALVLTTVVLSEGRAPAGLG